MRKPQEDETDMEPAPLWPSERDTWPTEPNGAWYPASERRTERATEETDELIGSPTQLNAFRTGDRNKTLV